VAKSKVERVITPYKGGRFNRVEFRVTQETIDGIRAIVEWRKAHGQPKFSSADWLERAVRNEVEAIEAAAGQAPQAQKGSEA